MSQPASVPPRPDLPPLRDVIARYGLNASKALGQNFLLDAQLLARIARIPGDLNDAWKTGHSRLDPVLAEAAVHLGVNVVYYAVTHYLEETRKYRK